MKMLSTLLATVAVLTLPQIAAASSQTADNLNVCATEIRSQIQDTESKADLDFKSVKGNSRLQTLTFRIEAQGERDTVRCKVRRDDSVEIVWGKSVKPKPVLSFKADAKSGAGE